MTDEEDGNILTAEEVAAMDPADIELAIMVKREERAAHIRRMWALAYAHLDPIRMREAIALADEHDVMLEIGED